jgi:ABC-type Mn2+/Zn2+ transport system ATPase subunit
LSEDGPCGAEPAVVLETRGLELDYGRGTVLAGVDLAVRAGEAWCLLGPNGSGKTTLLRAILGLLKPRRGRLVRHPVLASCQRLGFVPQVSGINPSLRTTVREFVSLGLAASDVAGSRRSSQLAWALERVGLTALASTDYWELSGGQQRRALLARALVRRPGWMLLDEPTEGLDIATEELLLATLDDLNRRDGVTLIVITHDLAVAANHASHVALFDGGRVLGGERDEVLRSEPAARLFGRELELLL